MCQGGISRRTTRSLIDFAHGRVSSYVTSDMGAAVPGRWHSSHRACRIGAMSLVKVGTLSAANASDEATRSTAIRFMTPAYAPGTTVSIPLLDTWEYRIHQEDHASQVIPLERQSLEA